MRKFKIGESAKVPSLDIEGGTVTVRGTIIKISPDKQFVKLRLDDDLELIIEIRFLKEDSS